MMKLILTWIVILLCGCCEAQTTNKVTLKGTASDSDGFVTSYRWSKVSGPSCSITTPNDSSTVVTFNAAGIYIFRLTVTDNQGLTGSDDVKVTVNPPKNRKPKNR